MSDGITTVSVGGMKIGLIGLSDIIEEVNAMNLTDEAEIKNHLLAKVKSQNYVTPFEEEEYGRAVMREYQKFLGLPVSEEEGGGLVIRVLGPGCYACDKLEQDVKIILAELGIAADVQHIRDVKEIAKYGMVLSPALVINNKVYASGKAPTKTQLQERLKKIKNNEN